jgi:plasmid stabilization system protein ParE
VIELIYTEQALLDLERLSDFLLETDPQAAVDTAALIFDALEVLVQHPEVGRKIHFGQRELVISRGRSGYLALYRFLPHIDPSRGQVLVLAIRHQREAGYKNATT